MYSSWGFEIIDIQHRKLCTFFYPPLYFNLAPTPLRMKSLCLSLSLLHSPVPWSSGGLWMLSGESVVRCSLPGSSPSRVHSGYFPSPPEPCRTVSGAQLQTQLPHYSMTDGFISGVQTEWPLHLLKDLGSLEFPCDEWLEVMLPIRPTFGSFALLLSVCLSFLFSFTQPETALSSRTKSQFSLLLFLCFSCLLVEKTTMVSLKGWFTPKQFCLNFLTLMLTQTWITFFHGTIFDEYPGHSLQFNGNRKKNTKKIIIDWSSSQNLSEWFVHSLPQ